MSLFTHPRVARLLVPLVGALCLAWPALGQPDAFDPPQPAVGELAEYDAARALFDQRQRPESIVRFEGWLKRYPESELRGSVYYFLGAAYYDTKQYAQASTYLERLRDEALLAPAWATANGLVYLHRLHLDTGNWERANAVRDDVYRRFPKTTYATRVAEATYLEQMKDNPVAAQSDLGAAAKQGVLPYAGLQRLWPRHMDYMQTARPAEFLQECRDYFATWTCPTVPEELALPADIARRAYRPLMEAGRYDEAAALAARVTAAFVHHGNPANGVQANRAAYFGALAACDCDRLAAEATHLAEAAPAGRGQLEGAVQAARLAYGALADAGRSDDMRALHELVARQAKARAADDLAGDDLAAYTSARLRVANALEKTHPTRFVDEGMAYFAACAPPRSLEELAPRMDLARRLYRPLMAAGRCADAHALATAIGNACTRLNETKGGQSANRGAYAAALAVCDGAVAIAEGQRLMQKPPATRAEAETLVDTLGVAYRAMVAAGHVADMEAVHTQVVPGLKRLGAPDLLFDETLAYILRRHGAGDAAQAAAALAATPELIAVLPGVTRVWDAPTVERVVGLCGALMTAGRFRDAQALHEALRARLARAASVADLRAAPDAAALVRGELAAYAGVVYAGLDSRLRSGLMTPEQHASYRDLCVALWKQDVAGTLPGAMPLVRDRLAATPQMADWLPGFAAAVKALPAQDTNRPAAMLALAQVAHQVAVTQKHQTPALRADAIAEEQYRALLRDYPGQDIFPVAASGLLDLLQRQGRVTDIAALVATLDQDRRGVEVAVAALDWLGDYHLRLGSVEEARKAQDCFARLVAAQPKHALAPVWQFRYGWSLELQGKADDACDAYRKVVHWYPDSSCVVAAKLKLAELGGRG